MCSGGFLAPNLTDASHHITLHVQRIIPFFMGSTALSSAPQLREISPAASEARRLRDNVFKNLELQAWKQSMLQQSFEKRKLLIDKLTSTGLIVSPVTLSGVEGSKVNVHEDLSLQDDGGKLIETLVRVPAYTADQVRRVYEIAEMHQLGVMTLGAKTSALGVFSAWETAKLHGLNGIIALEMPAVWLDDESPSMLHQKDGIPKERLLPDGSSKAVNSAMDLLDLPDLSEGEEVIHSEKFPIAVIKNSKGLKHRVIAHATVTVKQVNDFLELALPKDAHYQIMPDLTSKGQASLGGVIATGAQGGNRASARVDLLKCNVVDALGERVLEDEDAKTIVGYNGYLGTCVQAEFEVTAFPKHPYGFMVPIPGATTAEAWKNMLKFQALLSPHCVHPDKLSENPEGYQQTMVSSMEILGPEQLTMGIQLEGSRAEELNVLTKRFPDARLFVYVTGSTHLESDGSVDYDALLKDKIFSETLSTMTAVEPKPLNALDEESFLKLQEEAEGSQRPFSGVYPLLIPELLEVVDSIRHKAPETARAEAIKIGNVTQSTDFNIQFTGTPEEQERSRDKVAALFSAYQERFSDGPYRVDIYGHLFQGMFESPLGGGMDPHVRVSLNLSHPDTRNDSPERVNEMKSILSKLYDDLLRLHGVDGVVVAPPEKSHLTNLSYVEWVRLHNPTELLRLQKIIFDSLPDSERQKRMIGGFRVPIEFPGEPRYGMKSFLPAHLLPPSEQSDQLGAYADAVMEISQLSHRGATIKGMFREVVVTLREKLKLHPFVQHPFFIESPDEGRRIIERNLGTDHPFQIEEVTDPIDFSALGRRPFKPNTIYLIPSELLGGIPGTTVMITPHRAILKADERKRSGENKADFRNLVQMFRAYPYETTETPNIPAVACLGLALQREELKNQASHEAHPVVSVNPGPTQLHPHIREVVRKHGFLQSNTPDEQRKDATSFRDFMRMPRDMEVGFTGSATQCMEIFAESVCNASERVYPIQVTNGAFSERFQKIFKSHGVLVATVKTPWTTAEASQGEYVVAELARMIKDGHSEGKKPVLFVTPHKTDTTANFHPSLLIYQLGRRGFKIGQDYQLVCDVTSGAGAIDYFDQTSQDGVSVFGSVQKGLGCPSGLGFIGMTKELREMLDPQPGSHLDYCLQTTKDGEVPNGLSLRMLGEKSRFELEQGRTPDSIMQETKEKVDTIMGFIALHPELSLQVPSGEDLSPLEVGIYSLTKNLSVAARLMREIFGFDIGAGYGPFANESLRIYLPNITKSDLDRLLSALHEVLSMPEVTPKLNPPPPLVTLREPHNPMKVLKEMLLRGVRPDDLFRNRLGLGWIGRLKFTLKLVEKNLAKQKEGDSSAHSHHEEIPYGSEENIQEIRNILECRLEGRMPLISTFTSLEGKILQLENILLNGDEIDLQTVDDLTKKMFDELGEIVLILEKYALTAPKTDDGLIRWPLTATPDQGNGALAA